MTTQASWVPRINITKMIAVTPTISTSPAYTSGDQLGGIMTLSNVVRQDSNTGIGSCELHSVTILDGGLQSAAIDLWFFSISPTVTSTDNAAFSMSDANLAAQCIGAISVGTSYSASALNSVSTDGKNIGLCMNVPFTNTANTNIFAIAVVRGTPTYVSTTDLQFQFSFYID